eukprot:1180571-Prorocentrum_minimum.AAC.3
MAVTLHTNLGELKLELFCDECPKAAEVRSGPARCPLSGLVWNGMSDLGLSHFGLYKGPTDFRLHLTCVSQQNFLALCASNAYNGTIFHRCAKPPPFSSPRVGCLAFRRLRPRGYEPTGHLALWRSGEWRPQYLKPMFMHRRQPSRPIPSYGSTCQFAARLSSF